VFAPLVVKLLGHPPNEFHPTAIDPNIQTPLGKFGGINRHFLLGVEPVNGRDLFSRVVYGSRISLLIAFFATLLSVLIGTFFGIMAGYFGGWVDSLISRAMDLFLAFPLLVFALALAGVVLVHLLAAPHTKVEESFNMQAVHDIIVYGTPIRDIRTRIVGFYDHMTFPGAVPRTFVGAVLLAGLGQPLVEIFGFEHAQFIIRAVLGLANAGAIIFFASRLAKGLGNATACWYLAMQMSQFHIMFYASRTLPNMFAFPLSKWRIVELSLSSHCPRRV
jgi:hypothetical protein